VGRAIILKKVPPKGEKKFGKSKCGSIFALASYEKGRNRRGQNGDEFHEEMD